MLADSRLIPGTKTVRGTALGRAALKAERWDGTPKYLTYKGQAIEVFLIGAFAKALNRQVPTIRALERLGVICAPSLRMRTGQIDRRVYTRDQIEDMVVLAREEKCLDPKLATPFSERFIEDAHKILRRKPA